MAQDWADYLDRCAIGLVDGMSVEHQEVIDSTPDKFDVASRCPSFSQSLFSYTVVRVKSVSPKVLSASDERFSRVEGTPRRT